MTEQLALFTEEEKQEFLNMIGAIATSMTHIVNNLEELNTRLDQLNETIITNK